MHCVDVSAADGDRPLRILQLITDRERRGAQVFALDLAVRLRASEAEVETVALVPGVHGDLLPVRALGTRRLGWRTLKELRRLVEYWNARQRRPCP